MKNSQLGILLVNLGTPDYPTIPAVRRYLAQFLSDPKVIELPRWFWLPILHGIILRTRPKKSAHAYQKIWTNEGSPLFSFSKNLAENLQQDLPSAKVVLGMRYGTPSLAQSLESLRKENIKKLIVLPLFPQYSKATTASIYAEITRILKDWQEIPAFYFINHYAEHPSYIAAVSQHIENFWQQHSRGEKLLFSFHGLPKRSIEKGDPYFSLCHASAALVAEQLQLTKDSWQVAFQSRFGFQKWLQPYCDKTLKYLAKQGYKKVDIICPGFAVDCLETLEEIKLRYQEIFIAAGGKELRYIPALNATKEHATLLADLIKNSSF